MSFSPAIAAFATQVAFAAIGLVLLWRKVLSPRARSAAQPPALPVWNGDAVEMLLFLGLIMGASFFAALCATSILKSLSLKGDASAVISGAAAQLGMLVGVLTFAVKSSGYRAHAPTSAAQVLGSGVATFMIALPILDATSKAWELLLALFGIPAERQDLIRMFTEVKSPWLIGTLIALAIAVAPVTEELVFRAGLFRFFRTRAPRILALLVPALIFAALHVNWSTLEGFASFAPLLALALLFSLAYERTGHIGTTIVAHALFNLNTIVLIYCGLAQ